MNEYWIYQMLFACCDGHVLPFQCVNMLNYIYICSNVKISLNSCIKTILVMMYFFNI